MEDYNYMNENETKNNEPTDGFNGENGSNVFYDQSRDPKERSYSDGPDWLAIVGFILSILNLCLCCCCTYIFAPASIVLCIAALVRKGKGTGFAISGIVISAFTVIFMIISNVLFGEMSNDLTKIINDAPKYAQEYHDTGEIPMEYSKFTDEKYDKYWAMFGFDSFEEFYKAFMDLYSGVGGSTESQAGENALDDDDFYNGDDEDTDRDDDFGEQLIDL